MADTGRYLTFDLGAESGRAVLGTVSSERIGLEEVHRFPNEPQWILNHFHWDTPRLFAEMKRGLARCVREHSGPLDGVGVDTWGVDYALMGRTDELLGLPYHYRDGRTDGAMDSAFTVMPREDVYRATGIQFMPFNTLFQLVAHHQQNPALLDSAVSLLMTPDLLNFWLTGVKATESTIASTTQMVDPYTGGWGRAMLEKLGVPTHFLHPITPTATVLGPLHASVMRETDAEAVPVIMAAEHDTGSAVAAVPAEGRDGWAYVSCGTWSLVGIEAERPLITDQTLAYNLTNEGGVNGTFRVLRNVMGLWLLQQCRRAWERQGRPYAYDELASMADSAPAFGCLIEPDDPGFLNPADMPEAIAAFCQRTGQRPPDGVAATVRAIVEGLALKYRWVVERLEAASGTSIGTVHIIGGGCQNRALCQATADATGRRVVAGPVEATALGNIAVQAMATGRLGSLAEARALIGSSFPLARYVPRDPDAWEEPYARFLSLVT